MLKKRSKGGLFLPVFLLAAMALQPLPLRSQIINIEDQRITGTNDSTRWYGQVQAGATVAKVQAQILQLNAGARVEYKEKKEMVLFLLDAVFLRAGGTNFTNAGFSHLRYNHKLTDAISTEVFVQAQYNRLLLIQLRTLGGAGLRYRLYKNKTGKSRIYAGNAYLYEINRFTNEIPDRSWHRLSSYLSFTFRPWAGVQLISTTYFQPQITDWHNYRFSTECKLDTPLGKKLSFSTNFRYSTDRALPLDAPVFTYTWVNGVVYRF